MSRRELIIVVMMCLVLVYAGYSFLFEKATQNVAVDTARMTEELNRFVQDSTLMLQAGRLSKREAYSIAKAEAKWLWNPFYIPPEAEQDDGLAITLLYSGYVIMGEKKMAVINGLEYAIGETLLDGGFVVREIDPDRVTVAVEGKKQTIVVPLSE